MKATSVFKIYDSKKEYKKYMSQNKTFGTDYEIGIFCNMFETMVKVYEEDYDINRQKKNSSSINIQKITYIFLFYICYLQVYVSKKIIGKF